MGFEIGLSSVLPSALLPIMQCASERHRDLYHYQANTALIPSWRNFNFGLFNSVNMKSPLAVSHSAI
jgi:hypothetical protein